MPQWDSNVQAVWSFEQNGADDVGGYDLTAIGTPTNVNEGDAKLGSYTNKVATANNIYRLSDAFITYASGLSAFTIEGWDKRGTATGGLWDIVFLAGWLDTASGFGLGSNTYTNNAEFNVKGTHPFFAIGVTQGDWYHWSIEWTGKQARCYINGVLKAAINTTTNPFSGLGYNIGIGQSTLYNNLNTATRHDKFIFSDIARGGVETLPISDGKAGIRYGFVCGGNPRVKIGGTI